jgi:hypothetical protein
MFQCNAVENDTKCEMKPTVGEWAMVLNAMATVGRSMENAALHCIKVRNNMFRLGGRIEGGQVTVNVLMAER